MAEKKLTIATLRKMLAKQTGMPESKVGTFLNVFFPAIVNGLIEDGQVKLNGLGTFRVQSVQPRKSVNIKTGESIIIDGYNKVVFTAETAIKEQVNAEFSHLASQKLNDSSAADNTTDPLKKLGEQADEIKDILAELGATVPIDSTESQLTEDITAEDTTIDDIETPPDATEVEDQQNRTEKTEQEVETTNEVIHEDIVESPVSGDSHITEGEIKSTPAVPFQPWKVACITILIFCLMLVGAYFFLKHKIISWADGLIENSIKTENTISEKMPIEPSYGQENATPAIVQVEQVDAKQQETEQAEIEPQSDDETSKNEIATTPQVVISTEEQIVQQWFADTRTYADFIKTETLNEGSRLSHLSKKYYGAPDFWVYIYEANKSIIRNPNQIGVGTKLRIPRLPAVLIDTNNARAMQQAKDLHNQILGIE